MIKRIAVFDFDGTLVDTPLPDFGKVEYERVTGTKWPHRGWWGCPESLDMKIFEMPVVQSVIDAYHRERALPDTLVIMMTGRMKQLEVEVKAILDSKGLTFDKYVFNSGGDTMSYKIRKLGYFVKDNPTAETVAMWEDRKIHCPHFINWGAEQKNIKFEMTIVPQTHRGE
jgi:hypothetical protein